MFLESTNEENDDYLKRFDHHSADMSNDTPSPVVFVKTNLCVEENGENCSLMETLISKLRMHSNVDTNVEQLRDELFLELNFLRSTKQSPLQN